jgi:hypothetical protein
MPDQTSHDELLKLIQKHPGANQEAFGSPELGQLISQELGITPKDLMQSVAASSLDPDVTGDLLYGFATGNQSSEERQLAETLLEIDPQFWSDVRLYREEVAEAATLPLGQKRAATKRWLTASRLAWSGGLAACLLAGVVLFQYQKTQSQLTVASLERGDLLKRVDSLDAERNLLSKTVLQTRQEAAKAVLENGTALKALRDQIEKQKAASASRALPLAQEGGHQLVRIGDEVAEILPKRSPISRSLSGSISVRSTTSLGQIPVTAGGGAISLVRPDLTSIATLSPELVWLSPSGAKISNYSVTVFTPNGIVLGPVKIASNSYKVGLGSLYPGKAYGWRVTAITKDGDKLESAVGRFEVLDEKELAAAQVELSNPRIGHLERALFAAKVGLLDDAEKELSKVRFTDRAFEDRIRTAIQTARNSNSK